MAVIAGIYARISQDRSDEGLGVQRQIEDCTALAARKGWTVKDQYVDNDVSATKSKPRPAYQRLMEDLNTDTINAVVVYDVDRLTRKPMELEEFILLVESKGVALANVTGDIDLSSDDGKMMARIKGALARQEADKMGRRLKRQKQQRAEQGKPTAGRYPTFGYTRDWEIVPEQAEWVRDTFRRTIAGESTQSIADAWTAAGRHMGNGKTVYFSTIKNVVRRALYAGIAVHNGEVVGKSVVPAIIDEATFTAAQAALDGRPNSGPRGKNARVYLLSGFIRCGECASPMGGGPTAPNKQGKKSYKYACRKAIGGCGKVSVSGPPIDAQVLTRIRQDLIVHRNPNRPKPIDYQPRIKALEADRDALQQAVKDKSLAVQDAIPMIDDLRTKINVLNREEAAQVSDDFGGFTDWDEFCQGTISEQKATVGRIIQGIYVYSGDGKTVWNGERIKIEYVTGNVVSAIGPTTHVNALVVVGGWRQNR